MRSLHGVRAGGQPMTDVEHDQLQARLDAIANAAPGTLSSEECPGSSSSDNDVRGFTLHPPSPTFRTSNAWGGREQETSEEDPVGAEGFWLNPHPVVFHSHPRPRPVVEEPVGPVGHSPPPLSWGFLMSTCPACGSPFQP